MENKKIDIIKTEKEWKSKQVDEKKGYLNIIEPKIDFRLLLDIYSKSFIASGITDKIASTGNSGFEWNNQNLIEKLNKVDIEFIIKNLIITWNCFLEIIRNWRGEIIDLLPILTEEIKLKADKKGFVQKVAMKESEFKKFNKKNFTFSWKNEVYHFKNSSLRNKDYGESIFESTVDELALINYIDTYYTSYFENQAIRPNVFTDPEGKLSNKDKETLSEFFRAKLKWANKAFSTAIIPSNLQKLDLGDEIDASAFIEYRKELIKSICMRLNIPYDLMISDSSNRSASQISKEVFINYTIKPLQDRILKWLKEIFSKEEGIESIKFKDIDSKDKLREAEIYEKYVKMWVLTPEEAKKIIFK